MWLWIQRTPGTLWLIPQYLVVLEVWSPSEDWLLLHHVLWQGRPSTGFGHTLDQTWAIMGFSPVHLMTLRGVLLRPSDESSVEPEAPSFQTTTFAGTPYFLSIGMHVYMCIYWLVVVSTPLKNISQLGWLFPIYGKIKNVPNHQPVYVLLRIKYTRTSRPSSYLSLSLCRYPPRPARELKSMSLLKAASTSWNHGISRATVTGLAAFSFSQGNPHIQQDDLKP